MTSQAQRTILAAVDFGEASARAVEAAGVLAARWPAELRVLHAEASEAPVYFTHDQIEALAAQRKKLQDQALAFLDRFGRRHTARPFTPVLVPRPPTDAILDQAKSAALTVMGTHGRRGPRRWWLGSVAERVLREIGTPLLVVRETTDVSALCSRVCVCAEAPQAGDQAMALAEELARPFGGTVTDRRGTAVAGDEAEAASLVVIGIPPPDSHSVWSPFSLSCVRKDCRAVLFVPSTGASAGRL